MTNKGYLKIRSGNDVDIYNYHDLNKMLYDAARCVCFDDCSDEELVDIVWDGRDIYYCGWMPNMTFRFRYEDTGEMIAEFHCPEWDH